MKITVAVLFGGKSVEHEISVISAVQAMGYLDAEKYEKDETDTQLEKAKEVLLNAE